jgi:hypothetical protein
MSFIQKLFFAVLPKKWAENMEAESRRWMTRCPCGVERSIWETGGIRWKAAGKERLYLTCPKCRQSHWHKVYKLPATELAKPSNLRPASSIEQRETRKVFRVLAGILAVFLLLGPPAALYGVFAGSGEHRLWDIFWAISCLYGGVGLAGGARAGRWFNVRG